jgi:dTDP-4-amino-4,6-dideoxy-D-galactose acyltransferase
VAMTTPRVERPNESVRDRPRFFELNPLDWDTAFFGERMGSIVATGTPQDRTQDILSDDLGHVLDEARAQGYAHLILRAAAHDSLLIWAAEHSGLRLIDIGIDSTLDLARTATPDLPDGFTVRAAEAKDVSALSELSAEAFTLSRFSADPFFSDEQVKDFHRTWTRNLCNGLAQAVLVAEVDGALAGFVSCSVSGDEGRIPLIGVAAGFRGRQIGQGLIAAALRWFRTAGCRLAHVKTQAHNYRALALYHRAGFVVSKSELTFSVVPNASRDISREVLQ